MRRVTKLFVKVYQRKICITAHKETERLE